jgi:hypothetical protein
MGAMHSPSLHFTSLRGCFGSGGAARDFGADAAGEPSRAGERARARGGGPPGPGLGLRQPAAALWGAQPAACGGRAGMPPFVPHHRQQGCALREAAAGCRSPRSGVRLGADPAKPRSGTFLTARPFTIALILFANAQGVGRFAEWSVGGGTHAAPWEPPRSGDGRIPGIPETQYGDRSPPRAFVEHSSLNSPTRAKRYNSSRNGSASSRVHSNNPSRKSGRPLCCTLQPIPRIPEIRRVARVALLWNTRRPAVPNAESVTFRPETPAPFPTILPESRTSSLFHSATDSKNSRNAGRAARIRPSVEHATLNSPARAKRYISSRNGSASSPSTAPPISDNPSRNPSKAQGPRLCHRFPELPKFGTPVPPSNRVERASLNLPSTLFIE